jgi:hypothetical protein
MAKLNSEFNYRYQVIGETVWEKIKTLLGFMDGRKRAAALETIGELRTKASYEKLAYLKQTEAPAHEILMFEADLLEGKSAEAEMKRNFEDNRAEIAIIEKLLGELYELAEPTRLRHKDGTPYSDEEMFEVNAANEFTVLMAREMQAEIIANGRPSAAKIKNAMSNPITWSALKQIGIIEPNTQYIVGSVDPTVVQLLPVEFPKLAAEKQDIERLALENAANPQLSRKPVQFS